MMSIEKQMSTKPTSGYPLPLTAALAICVIWTLILAVYRLYFHPLRHFPGPRLAAITGWWEFYFEVIKDGGGQYGREILRMHERYGPIVRITPDELHVDDPDFYEVLFAGRGQIRNKHPPAARMVGTTLGIFSTIDFHAHRKRRAALNHFFSKAAVRAKQAMMMEKMEELCTTLEKQCQQEGFVRLQMPLLAFATDFFYAYAIGEPPHPNLLTDLNWQAKWRKTLDVIGDLTPLVKQFPCIVPFVSTLPRILVNVLVPDLARILAMRDGVRIMAETHLRSTTKGTDVSSSRESYNAFTAILESDLPAEEKRLDRLEQEGFELLGASGETVSKTATVGLFHLLSDESKLKRLQNELQTVFMGGKDFPTMQELENLPYLRAVVRESLRISATVSARLPLVAPTSTLEYCGHVIPAETPVSMTPSQFLLDKRCFVNAESFLPERWLGENGHKIPHEKYFLPFSRGVRGCPGINIAQDELCLIFAVLVSRYDISIFDTIRERDIDHARDCFVGKPVKSSKGLRISLHRRFEIQSNSTTDAYQSREDGSVL